MKPGPGVVNEPGVVIVDVRDVRVLRPAPDDQTRVHGLAAPRGGRASRRGRPAPDDQAPPTPYARTRRPPARWRKAHSVRPGR